MRDTQCSMNVIPAEWSAETIMVPAGWPETNDWEEVGETSVPWGVVMTRPAVWGDSQVEKFVIQHNYVPNSYQQMHILLLLLCLNWLNYFISAQRLYYEQKSRCLLGLKPSWRPHLLQWTKWLNILLFIYESGVNFSLALFEILHQLSYARPTLVLTKQSLISPASRSRRVPAVMMPVEGTGSTVMFWVLWGGLRCPALPTWPPPSVLGPGVGMVRRAVW